MLMRSSARVFAVKRKSRCVESNRTVMTVHFDLTAQTVCGGN